MTRIGITMGDPAGVGPEIICRALAELPAAERAHTVVFGTLAFLERANALAGTGLTFEEIGDVPQFPSDSRLSRPAEFGVRPQFAVPVVDVHVPNADAVVDARITPAAGECSYRYIERAVKAALAGEIAVIVTAPINKEALHAAGHHFDGHTELLAHLTGAKSSFMLLASEKLSTIHVSTHVSLADAVKRATTERELATIRTGHAHCQRLGIARPRIAVAGLNPHCGENGLFGNDEQEHIVPAIEQARREGIEVTGPVPPDTVFYRAMHGEFDLVVAQYHDQGHIPTKLIAFDTTVNVSLGLPILRTSVDHGTAFDIAWKGIARHANMLAAIAYARRIAGHARAAAVGAK